MGLWSCRSLAGVPGHDEAQTRNTSGIGSNVGAVGTDAGRQLDRIFKIKDAKSLTLDRRESSGRNFRRNDTPKSTLALGPRSAEGGPYSIF